MLNIRTRILADLCAVERFIPLFELLPSIPEIKQLPNSLISESDLILAEG